MYEDEEDYEEYEEEEDDELELCIGSDGVLHFKEKRPTLSLAFKTEEEMINFMAKCSFLGLNYTLIIPEGTMWNVENVSDQDVFLERVNATIEDLTKQEN